MKLPQRIEVRHAAVARRDLRSDAGWEIVETEVRDVAQLRPFVGVANGTGSGVRERSAGVGDVAQELLDVPARQRPVDFRGIALRK